MKLRPLLALRGAPWLAVLAVHLWSLLRYPAPFVDEAWYASRAWAFLRTGQPFGVLDAGVFERYPGYQHYFQWLPVMIQSAALRLSGGLDLLPLRAVSLGFGILLLASITLLGMRLGGRRLAFLSALLVALSQPFFYSAHMARYDVMVAALGFLSLGLVLANEHRRFELGALAGLVLAVSFEIHPNAMIFGPVIVAVGLAAWGRSYLSGRDFGAFAGATLLGLLVYGAIHILPNPQTYFALDRLVYGPTHLPPLVTGSPALMLAGLQDEMAFLLFAFRLEFLAAVVATAVLAFSKSRNDRVLAVLGVTLFLSQALLVRNKLTYYAILVTPGLDLVLGALLLRCAAWLRNGPVALRAAAVTAILAVLFSLCVGFLPLRWNGDQDYERVQLRLDRDVLPSDVLMASQVYWFGLSSHRYYSWEQLVYFQRDFPGCGLRDALQHFRPDLFIMDGHLQEFMSDSATSALYSGLLALPRAPLDEILATQGVLVDRFDGGSYGQVAVYRLTWPPALQRSSSCPG
jgi:hypothetical protein